MNKENINRRNTREWVKVNEDAKASYFRNLFISEHGGIFEQEGRYWTWKEVVKTEPKPKTNWIFVHPDGKEELVENLSKFSRKHDLNKSAMYDVYNGKRNHHKQFKLKKQGD